jgi:hypothetical protein
MPQTPPQKLADQICGTPQGGMGRDENGKAGVTPSICSSVNMP